MHERYLTRRDLDTMSLADVDQLYRAEVAFRDAEVRAYERKHGKKG